MKEKKYPASKKKAELCIFIVDFYIPDNPFVMIKQPCFFLFALLFFFFSGCHSLKPKRATGLRCEYIADPVGLDVDIAHPRLSWQLSMPENGQQTAWQVLAATRPELLKEQEADLWNSGKVVSDQSTQVAYGGKTVPSCTEVWWKVRVWDRHGRASAWSKPAHWETGLAPDEWQASWIGSPLPPQKTGGPNPAYYFRREIDLPAPSHHARAYISGLGYYELYINGKKVGDHVLAPNLSNYGCRDTGSFPFEEVRNMSCRIYYETFDISPYLQKGTNTLGIIVGNGFFFRNEDSLNKIFSYGLPRTIARFEIETDTGKMTLVTDTAWHTTTGPILHNGVFTGEIYDARREMPGWARPNYDDSSWSPAVIRKAPGGRLTGQITPPDRMIRQVQPVTVKRVNDSILRYDLGEMITGWARIVAKGKKGRRILLRFIEEQGPQYGQSDSYILQGQGMEVWQPRFTWHAFRYVELISYPLPDTVQLTGMVVSTDIKNTGFFECSNDIFNKINDNFIRTQQDNMHGGVPTNCPHRDRRGYLSDGQTAAPAALYNFDMSAFYTKWIDDIADGQNKVTGFIPHTIPFHGSWGNLSWNSAYIILPWYMYLYYGDTTIVKKHWEGMKKYIGYLERHLTPSCIVNTSPFTEWGLPQPNTLPRGLVSTAFFYHDLQIMSRLAGILGKSNDKSYFDTLAEKVKQGFNKTWLDNKQMTYYTGRQGANVLALGFGLVPEELVDKVFETLVNHLTYDTEGHFDTGTLGTPLLLQVLARHGRNDLAYTLMNQKDYPSFGLEILRGSTTLWETWSGNFSHSHPAFGSVCQWFYNTLAGILPDPGRPGFRHFLIRPLPVADLSVVSASTTSPYGRITSSWHVEDNDLFLDVTVPPNSTATVMLPAPEESKVSATQEKRGSGMNISFLGIKNDTASWKILPGKYRFISQGAGSRLPHALLTVPIVKPGNTLLQQGDTLIVTMQTDHDSASIRYTLDNNIPDNRSPLYTHPLVITRNVHLKARVFREGHTASPVVRRTYYFSDPSINGLNYEYYYGLWEKVPDFSGLIPTIKGVLHKPDLEEIPLNKDHFALRITGKIEIPASGTYTFFLTSNDDSYLRIDGKKVVNCHGTFYTNENEGCVYLDEGKHRITIGYNQKGRRYFLSLAWKGPGFEKERIPPSRYFYTPVINKTRPRDMNFMLE